MHKPGDKDGSHGKSRFRLHYFPDIPADVQSKPAKKQYEEVKFRRIGFKGEEKKNNPGIHENLTEKEERELKKIIKDVEVKAYVEGFNKGEKEGIAAGRKKIETVLEKMEAVVENLGALKEKIFRQNEAEIVKLSLAIARKIIDHEVSVNKAVIKKVILHALEKADNHEKIKIRMNPEDIRFIREYQGEIEKMADLNTSVTFEEDSNIAMGGCLVETGSGNVDARVEEQCRLIEESFDIQMNKIKPD